MDTPVTKLTARLAGGLLTATVALPALAFAIVRSGDSTSVLYTDPKLFALSVFGWLTVACLALVLTSKWHQLHLLRLFNSTPVWVLSLFVSYCSLSLLWAWVPQHTLYELNQWMLLFLLTLALAAAQPLLPNVATTLRRAMVLAAALVTLGGVLQAFGLIPWLLPIHPQAGVSNPSFMGYKNPTAQLIAAQWFLLVFEAHSAHTRKKPRQAILLVGLLLSESLYLLTLLCRTAYVALAGGALVLGVLVLFRIRSNPTSKRISAKMAATATILILVVGAGVLFLPGVSQRLQSVSEVLDQPDLAVSDRMVFWSNTIGMATEEPLGVGLGNWAAAYPLFREVARYRGFSTEVRVRDAHSDPIQFLGEVGWLGLLLWLLVWAATLRCAQRKARHSFYGQVLIAQGACLFLLQVADFPMQHPYTRAFFWWWLCLVLLRSLSHPPQTSSRPFRSSPPRKPGQSPRARENTSAKRPWQVLAVLLATFSLATGQLALHTGLLRDSLRAARLETTMYRLRMTNSTPSRAEFSVLTDARKLGQQALASPLAQFHPQAALRWITLAEACQRLNDQECQAQAAGQALVTAPYEPIALRQLANALKKGDPEAARAWNRLASFITATATRGLPPGIDPRDSRTTP